MGRVGAVFEALAVLEQLAQVGSLIEVATLKRLLVAVTLQRKETGFAVVLDAEHGVGHKRFVGVVRLALYAVRDAHRQTMEQFRAARLFRHPGFNFGPGDEAEFRIYLDAQLYRSQGLANHHGMGEVGMTLTP